MDQVPESIKVAIAGYNNSGKTSFALRAMSSEWCESTSYTPTVADSTPFAVQCETRKDVFVSLFDTTDPLWYENRLRPLSFVGSHVIAIAFSLVLRDKGSPLVKNDSDRDSFPDIESFLLPDCTRYAPKDVPIVLLGTKADLRNFYCENPDKMKEDKVSIVSFQEITKLAQRIKAAGYVETSFYDPVSVQAALQEFVEIHYQASANKLPKKKKGDCHFM